MGRQNRGERYGLCRDVVRFHIRIDIMPGRSAVNPTTYPMTTESAAFARPSRDLRVFISNRESRCDDCGEELGRRALIFLAGDRGALCLSCADLDHLWFLPPGDAALTRRARKYSTLAAVVLKWSRTRKRYERQGLLVEEQALQRAEAECLNDAEARAKRRDREAERRAEQDAEFVARFAQRVRLLYPGCPPDRPEQIAEHACQKYSGRVGRSAAAKRLDEDAVQVAVVAHVRHAETRYDAFLARGVDRRDARDRVRGQVDRVLARWRNEGDNSNEEEEEEEERDSPHGDRRRSKASDQDDSGASTSDSEIPPKGAR